MTEITCPYCGSKILTVSAEKFQPCSECGYSSARVESGSGKYVIIDSQLPNLMEVFGQLSHSETGSVILIDRRVGQKHVAGADRRC